MSSNSAARQNGLGSNGNHNGQSHFKGQNGNNSQNYHKEVGGQRKEFNRSGYDFNPFGTPYFQSSLIPSVDMHGRDQEWQEFVQMMNFGASGHLQDAETTTMSAPPPEEAHFVQSFGEKAEQYNPYYSSYHPHTGIASQSDGAEGIYNPLFSNPPVMAIPPQRNFREPGSTNTQPPLALNNNSAEISPKGSPRSETEKGEQGGERREERGGTRDGERHGKRHGERYGEWVKKEGRQQETTSENISRSWASIAISSTSPPDDPIPLQLQPTFVPQKNRTGEPKVKPVELPTVPPKREKSPTVSQFGPAVDPKLVEKYSSLAEVNITSVDCQPSFARFFVIKSYSEDDIHKSIKYNIWASTDSGNRRLDNAFRELANKGPLYLFFSVNASGQFCGMAQMLTPLDYNTKSNVWAQDKWNGQFEVRWILIKDIPNGNLRHIRLSNNENKPVTNSRDTQEILLDPGKELLRLFLNYKTKSSLLDDFSFYDKRQEEMKEKKEKKAKEKEESLATGSSRRQRPEKN